MALQNYVSSSDPPSIKMKPLRFSTKVRTQLANVETDDFETRDVDVDLREVYFLIMHFLSTGPCKRTYGQFWNELLENQLLPRRYHAWYSRAGEHSGQENDDGMSFPLSYSQLVQRNPHIETDHLIKLLKQLLLTESSQSEGKSARQTSNAADVPTLLGTGSFSLLSYDGNKGKSEAKRPPVHMRWPHMHADQVRGIGLREIGGGFTRHHRAPSIRAACYAIAKPSTMVQKMQNIKRVRGHRNAVYCATFDQSGRYVITGSDDRLVKIWSMETAYCLASCRGHEGDITDLAVSSNNFMVASSSNDCIIRVWHLPDGQPISVLKGHTGAVTSIAFSPRPGSVYQLLSSSDDGTCRIWDARSAEVRPRIYVPKPSDSLAGKNNGSSSTSVQQSHQIFCCAFNANGTVFVTGSSDTLARVWIACKTNADDSDQPNHEIDVLAGHENDVNYVQFSGSVSSRYSTADSLKEESVPKFRNSWFSQDNIVTCSRDGSAIIWIPRSRRSHGKVGRWCKHYHLKVPPPPLPPQPPRGGPRQRILPTPRGVNMIIWSLDNRFVLAAIMDCRICVWNAADGSLVHSLSGHTDSTYVLDVHPFNPRIAMSAGYDGRTIVWDIWEGTPIRIYEIARFKLVDGKFSSDGTSIILSDDVGQLYILNTGQGESQKDAKYDQFFLGDYRPLIHDTSGNSLDLETQLATYRRNMQDLLCDSGMIPYTEPYQTMYQKRRLGALGLEWKPCALNLSVGPNFTLDQDYQIPPLADLDSLAAPLPALLDAMDWEPEIEVQSDANDSEYNVIEEYSTGGEQGSLGSLSGYPECSTDDSELDDTHKDALRRSKRKKPKAEIEFMTSSGRHVKRRNLDECDGNPFSNGSIRKSRNGQKALRRKSSTSKTSSKSSRPRRAAARNALHLFSKITGTSTDGEDEYDSEGDSSESESVIQDSYVESDEPDRDLPNGQIKLSKGKEVFFGESEHVAKTNALPESHNAGNGRRLVLKLPARDPNKLVPPESTTERKVDRRENSVGLSWKASEGGVKHISSSDIGCSIDANNTMIARVSGQSDKIEDHLDLTEGYKDGGHGAIKWGGVKARTSKRLKLGEPVSSDAYTGSTRWLGDHKEKENVVNGYVKPEKACATVSLDTDIQTCKEDMNGKVTMPEKNLGNEREVLDVPANAEDHSGPSEHIKYPESPKWGNRSRKDIHTLTSHQNGQPSEVKEGHTPISTKLRFFSKRTTTDNESPGLKMKLSIGHTNGGNATLNDISSERAKDIVSEVPLVDRSNDICSDNEGDGLQDSDAQVDRIPMSSPLDSVGVRPDSKKMYNVVYRRSKIQRGRSNLENAGAMVESTIIDSNLDRSMIGDLHEGSTNGAPNKRSSRLKGHVLQSEDVHRSTRDSSANESQLPSEEWGSSSRMAVGSRPTRNRRSNSYFHDPSPIWKPRQSTRKGSWLMLTTHEEGSRYIPQLGDEIVYLRQGHQEYAHIGSKEAGPWTSSKGGNMLRAVEFCRVEGLEYSTSPGSGESCCKMTLKFTDPSSSMFDRSFNLTLLDMTGFPDFIVERTRFVAAMDRRWSPRDKCKVWWKDESGDNGSWWDGRIVALKAKSCEFPDSPWERFTVRYRSEPEEPQLHSPWELFDADTRWEQPHIDTEIRDNLLLALARLGESSHKAQDQYAVNKLKQVSQKSNFTNRYPVPLSLDVIQSRLENNYYRSLEAVQHDIQVMLSNAESYFGRNAELLSKLKRLSDYFTQTFSSLQPS